MTNLGNLASGAMFFRALARRVSGAEQEGLEKAAKIAEEGAKNAIGGYSFGWPPLSESTLAKKSADTPLLETGALRASISHEIEPHRAIVGTNSEIGFWQEHGTSRGIPPRPFIGGAATHYADEIKDAVAGAVIKVLKG